MADATIQRRQNEARRQRFVELAKPKLCRLTDITTPSRPVQWGTQESIWPVSPAALRTQATPGLIGLALPKRNFQTGNQVNRPGFIYSCGRPSVVWQVNPSATHANTTQRLQRLSQAKQPPPEYTQHRDHFVYSCGRSSPIWKVSEDARECPDRQWTEDISTARSVHPMYAPNRQVRTIIPASALGAQPTAHLISLAEPKDRPEGPFRPPEWPVTPAAKHFVSTRRYVDMSRPKPLADGYLPAREMVWKVSRSTRRALATERMNELSRPIVRATMDHLQFDPDAFVVKVNALKGRCSQRVQELAQPIER